MQGGLLSESTNMMLNESNNIFTEGTILSLTPNDIRGIMTKKDNFIKVYDNFEFRDKSKVFYNESANNLFVIEADTKKKFVVPVENYMRDKVKDLIRKM